MTTGPPTSKSEEKEKHSSPTVKGRDYWIQFAVGLAMFVGVFYYDVDSGGDIVKDWMYGPPLVVMLSITPAQFLEALVAIAHAYTGRGK